MKRQKGRGEGVEGFSGFVTKKLIDSPKDWQIKRVKN